MTLLIPSPSSPGSNAVSARKSVLVETSIGIEPAATAHDTPHETPQRPTRPFFFRSKFMRRLHPCFSLRIILSLATIILIFFVASSTIIFSSVFQTEGIRSVTNQYQLSLNSRIESYTRSYFLRHFGTLKAVRSLVSTMEGSLDGVLENYSHQQKARFLHSFVSQQRDEFNAIIGGIMMGSERGAFTMLSGDSNYYFSNASHGASSPDLWLGKYNQQPELTVNLTHSVGSFNVTNRVWYKEAKKLALDLYGPSINNASAPLIQYNSNDREASFSVLMSREVRPTTDVSLSIPFFDGENRFSGVLSYVVGLPTISAFLRSIHDENTELSLIIDSLGYLVASTKGSVVEADGDRILAVEHADPLVAGLSQAMTEVFSMHLHETVLHTETVHQTFNSMGHLVTASCYSIYGVTFIVLVAIKESTIYERVQLMYLASAGMVLAIMIISAVFSLLFGYCAMRPLFSLAREMDKTRKLRLESIKRMKHLPRLYEYFKIAQSFDELVRTLEEYKSFLPDYVIASSAKDAPKKGVHLTPVEAFAHENNVDESEDESDDWSSRVSSLDTEDPPETPKWGDRSFTKLTPQLNVGKIGYMIVRIHNTAKLSLNCEEYLRQYEKFVDIVGGSSSSGTVQDMQQDRVALTFTDEHVSQRLTKMIDSAFHIRSKVKELNRFKNVADAMRITISLCHSVLQHGVIGSNRNKRYSVYGVGKENCWLAAAAADRLQTKIVCDSDVFEFIMSQNKLSIDRKVYCAPVDVIRGVNGKECHVYSVKEKLVVHDTEWLYLLPLKNAEKAMAKMKTAFEALLQNRIEEASQLYSEVKELRPKDATLKRLVNICREWAHAGASEPSLREWMTNQTQSFVRRDGASLLKIGKRGAWRNAGDVLLVVSPSDRWSMKSAGSSRAVSRGEDPLILSV